MEVGVWGYVNHTAKQIVPFRAKNYQRLPTIRHNYNTWQIQERQSEKKLNQTYIGSDMPVAQKNEITGFQWQ